MLDRVGAAISDNQTIKSSPQKAIKKRADAYLGLQSGPKGPKVFAIYLRQADRVQRAL